MIKNYLIIGFRNLAKRKLYTTLNIVGLCFGLSIFLLIGLFLFDELTFDQQHSKIDQIYRVIGHKKSASENINIAAGSYKLAEEAKKRIPEIAMTTRMNRAGRANLINPDNPVNFQETVTSADENFLTIFDFPLLHGDKATALSEPNSILINEDLANRLFGSTDVMNKSLKWGHLDSPLKITGVLKNHPPNSSFDFNNVMSEATLRSAGFYQQMAASDWSSDFFSVYALLKPNSNIDLVSQKLTKMVLDNYTPPAGNTIAFSLQAMKDVHLYSEGILDGGRNTNVEAVAQGNPAYIRIFTFIALFVLIIAGINYMNLATSQASTRSKEIGVRKAVGAIRKNLAFQFLTEALIITGISYLISLVLVNLVLPAYNNFTSKQLVLGLSSDPRIWMISFLAALGIGLIAGSYPALLMSGFKPVMLLKGMKIKNSGNLNLRKGLVVFQFAISTIMIIGTIVLYQQVRFMNKKDLGFNKELLVVVDVNTGKARTEYKTIKTEMKKIPSVKFVSATSRVPGEWKTYRMIKIKNQQSTDEPHEAYFFGADPDFVQTFNATILKGRNFDTERDSNAVIINETMAKQLNITEPSDQVVDIPMVARSGTFNALAVNNMPYKSRVVGIIKDFHFQSLRDKIAPLVLGYHLNPIHGLDYYTARIDAGNIAGTLEQMKAVMVGVDSNDPFEYHFLDEQLARFYIEDYRRQTLLIWVALATIFIACLGLFGLATYAAEQRVKEIGVRKVLGASVIGLSALLTKDFLKLVLIANGIAFPIGWWASKKWLQEYAYHIEIEWWIFASAGLMAIVIALATVSYQAIKAAWMNPIKSLRSE